MTKTTKLFTLPDLQTLTDNNDGGSRVIVVSIIGKTSLNAEGIKIKSLGRLFACKDNRKSECTIEGYYDKIGKIVYLQVHTLLDTDGFIDHYNTIADRCRDLHGNDDFLVIYNEVKSKFVRALSLVLYVSHIVVISHPSHVFDINYLQYFKAVDNLRYKESENIYSKLSSIDDLNEEWIKAGRLCTPRVLFYFERCPTGVDNVKKFEHTIEDQIYSILRKSRIISNNISNSLFSIPQNDEYVYVNTDAEDRSTDRLSNAIRGLIAGCHQPAASNGVRPQAPFCDRSDGERSFPRFLRTHIQQARSRNGFDYVSGSRQGGGSSNATSIKLQIPTLADWASASKILYDVFMQQHGVKLICTETEFSKQRCLKVLPLAIAKYQEGIPSHYSEAIHKVRLAHALALFSAQARGPLYALYERQLISECNAFWEGGDSAAEMDDGGAAAVAHLAAAGLGGRQACEAPSMTGHGCELPRHGSDVQHCSGVRRVAACDCGRIQRARDDPYSGKQANYTFYHQLSKDCTCYSLERISFPVFQAAPGVDSRPADVSKYDLAAIAEDEAESNHGDDVDTEMSRLTISKTTYSAVEYLPGMLTITSPPSLLPLYNSWSLVCIGPSSLYSHNLGLPDTQQPGFLTATNFLLPWDKPIQYKTEKQLHESSSSDFNAASLFGGSRKKLNKIGINGRTHFTVKVFIGVEYECPKGHRFMLATRDRVLRAASGSLVKETGHQIVDSDMPLYYPCPCSASSTASAQSAASSGTGATATPVNKPALMAQLMRIHVVTPKAPVTVALSPRVQPAHASPIFAPVLNADQVCRLSQSAYWVLRLPFMYAYAANREHSVSQQQLIVETAPSSGGQSDLTDAAAVGEGGSSGDSGNIREMMIADGSVDEASDTVVEQQVVGDPTTGRLLRGLFAVHRDSSYLWWQ